ncbi:MAG: T9SS type A sorting domain-containing protein, partial [Bacteroidales bacterium]|nr:T9SS type A sorting domain-containing protein [Bacteroidales bacterium]
YPWANWGYFPTNYALCNNISVSASVIQGILPGEKPELSSMWTMLGNPAASIAVPYWPVGDPPDKANGSPTAPLCDLANEVREVMYDDYDMPEWINSYKLLDTLDGGIWTFTFSSEDIILDSTETLMNNWRGLDSIPVNAMLDVEEYFAEMAYNSLDSVFGIYVGLEPLVESKDFKVYPNPVSNLLKIQIDQSLEIDKISIYNQMGQQLIHLGSGKNTLDVSSLHSGMYIIEVFNGDRRFVSKFIK